MADLTYRRTDLGGVPAQHIYTALIRTKDSDATLEETLCRLEQQVPPPQTVVVVDSGSSDETLAIARRHGCDIRMYPAGEPFNYSRALNIGFSGASTPHVLVLSSHVWLTAADTALWMARLLEWPAIAAVFCPFGDFADFRTSRSPRFMTIDRENFTGLNGLSNCCAMYRRTDWERQPFDESIPTAEDQFWASKVFQTGKATVCLWSHAIDYRNPRATVEKAVRELTTVALYVLPSAGQSIRWWRLLLDAARSALGGDFFKARVRLGAAWHCFRHTVFGHQPFAVKEVRTTP